MLNRTRPTQGDILHSQTNVEEIPKENSPLITHEEIKNTPFNITGSTDQGYFIRLGDYRLTEIHKTSQEAKEELEKNQYNIIMRMIGAIIERYNETNKNNGM